MGTQSAHNLSDTHSKGLITILVPYEEVAMSRLFKLATVAFLCLTIVNLFPFVSRQLSAEDQDNDRSVMRITENTTLHVFNDGSMETAGDSGVEFIPLNTDTTGSKSAVDDTGTFEEIPVTRVKTTGSSLKETAQPTAAEDGFVTITYIASGTLSIAPDGTWLTDDGGRVEFIRMSRAEYEALADAAPTEPETVAVEIVSVEPDNNGTNAAVLGSGCTDYQAISYFTRGSSLKRTIDYCVNSSQNEIVKQYRLKNIGSVDSAILNKVLLAHKCPPGGVTTVAWESTSGPWIIAPNATLNFAPWVELNTGSGEGGVTEDWLYGTDIQSCFG